MRKVLCWQWVLIFLFFLACGGQTFLVNLRYVPQIPPALKVKPTTVAVAPFVDKRNKRNDVGLRRRLDGSLDRFTTGPVSAAEGAQKAVERFLRVNGFTVFALEGWDFEPESLATIDADLVMGGEVIRLWSRADSVAGRTIIVSGVEIVIYLGKPREGKVLEQRVEIDREVTQIVFSSEKVEEILNESLSESIESAFAKLLR